MFGLATGIYQSYFSTPQLNVLLLGGEGVGKTALLERLKVTQFSKKGPVVKRSFSCPAPPKYANAKLIQDNGDDGNDDMDGNYNNDNQNHQRDALQSSSERAQPSKRWLDHKQQSSLEDVDDVRPELGQDNQNNQSNQRRNYLDVPAPTGGNSTPDSAALEEPHEENQAQEFNLKPGMQMLPLHKIRPTSGQNLAKIDICGAKCHIFDISGKFIDLWERYYGDAEAVIFCWRVDYDAKKQREILESVRQEIPDDVPILIFAHVFHGTLPTIVLPPEEMTLTTELFLPNYHSNMMFAISGSAINGQGVREAMEWLIPLAKRQAKLRAQEAATAALADAR